MEVLTGGEERFSTTPNSSLHDAAFLLQGGIVKSRIGSWQELFLPVLHDRRGS